MSAGHPFRELAAVESTTTRNHVREWAEKLYRDQLRIWQGNAAAGRPNKPRAPTIDECLAKSREIRRRREVDSRYWNDLVSPNPIH